MKTKVKFASLIVGMSTILLISCNKSESPIIHKGDVKISYSIAAIDTIPLDITGSSAQGQLFLMDSCVYYSDPIYCAITKFGIESGEKLDSFLRKGRGENEIPSFLYAAPVKNSERHDILIVDNSLWGYLINMDSKALGKGQLIDFRWDGTVDDDYSGVSKYSLMEMTDFGIDFVERNGQILAPAQLVNRYLPKISSDRYAKGKTMASISKSSLTVDSVFGHFPKVYSERPTPGFEGMHFDYDSDNDIIFTSHFTDSLIYAYRYPDTPLFTLGFEMPGIDRGYTPGLDDPYTNFKNDISHVGINTALSYLPARGWIVRSGLCDFNSGDCRMQIYDAATGDLIFNSPIPQYSKYVGFFGDALYCAALMSSELGNKDIFYVYKITLSQSH
ncbi:MAG: hypothetical protein LUD17_16145 [Bacteroidales bacterium]|nr:hypothetical protein [Bacteroidales bacterium]